jgi:hypothetical protein
MLLPGKSVLPKSGRRSMSAKFVFFARVVGWAVAGAVVGSGEPLALAPQFYFACLLQISRFGCGWGRLDGTAQSWQKAESGSHKQYCLARAMTKSIGAPAFCLVVLATTLRDPGVHADEQQLSASLVAELPPELIDYRPPECPCIRYTPWWDLTTDQKRYAANLGYNRNSWNHHRQSYNVLEDLYWPALSPEQQSNATQLGYDHHKWTCCANHYEWHHWGHMGNWWPEAQIAYSVLGYSKPSWNRDYDYPQSAYKDWCRNVTGEQEGACFTELELFALKAVCFGSESVYRYDSLARPIWGTYYKPEHCVAEDEKRATLNDQENADANTKETKMPTGNPSVAPDPIHPGAPTSVMPAGDNDGKNELATSSSSATSPFVYFSLLCAFAGIIIPCFVIS